MDTNNTRIGDCINCNPTVKLEKGKECPVIDIDKITVGRKFVENKETVIYSGQGGAKFENGDTLMARITPCLENGKIAQARIEGKGIGSTELFVFRGKEGVTDNEYVYYFLKQQYIRNLAANSMTGASGRQRADLKFIKKIKLNLPTLDVQQRIASILSAYDNLIENNNKRIRLLEQMAENLYKEWFVRFRFHGHEKAEFENGLPKGWSNFALGDRYDITIGKTPPRKEFQWFTHDDLTAQNWMSISDMKDMFTGNTSEQLTQEAIQKFNMVVVPEKTILLSFKLTVGRITIASQPLCTNEAIAHIKNVPEIEHEFLYQQLKNYEYAKLGNTSAIGNAVNSKIIKRMEVLIPNEDIILSFHKIVFPIFEQIKLLSSQNKNLARQRDLLLPRLMSGKLEVKV